MKELLKQKMPQQIISFIRDRVEEEEIDEANALNNTINALRFMNNKHNSALTKDIEHYLVEAEHVLNHKRLRIGLVAQEISLAIQLLNVLEK